MTEPARRGLIAIDQGGLCKIFYPLPPKEALQFAVDRLWHMRRDPREHRSLELRWVAEWLERIINKTSEKSCDTE
jgi:hypothetical protein